MTSIAATDLAPGVKVAHREFGEGVVVSAPAGGFVRVFFSSGERQIPADSVEPALSSAERIVDGVSGTADRLRRVRLCYEAHALPLMESASALTAAKIDLLPHQVVLTHRVATASPRRFLIADEVGLGKTIETALLLRELMSRGEMTRALMVVPAGLVNNWHRELNEVFHLDFEVFGSEGDVTDRKTNAFVKHNRLIASIDTLKRPARVKRILEAPIWDLVVFDEAHHLTAAFSGHKVRKTENYKLAEALRNHTRDLMLLSATPHQGDHFRFWMLVQLLKPTLFKNAVDMVENRHRLNEIVMRRTKADACRPDGSPLFARRWVNTESFVMSESERRFYAELRNYLEDGFALAKNQGAKGRGLGFVMAIFQKIAASSFAAVTRTLRRRLIMLTIHEAILRDRDLDIDGRQGLLDDARSWIQKEYGFGDDPVGRSEADRMLADLKVRIVRRMSDDELELAAGEHASEFASAHAEELAASVVAVGLPEERTRIREVLAVAPATRETKVDKLVSALGALWAQNSDERVVVFATYLGTVGLIGREIEAAFPGKGVVVLKGGDHGAKVAAERRFRMKDGPKVLVCTAAGREGINLQISRVLFNFDLPWNPMDVEQRIGRIHRYGQLHTAQVYNLVLSDTIEGRIYLLLDEKLRNIARTLGKVDEQGNVAEDLRGQILGQLAERLSYEKLYQEALSDPELRRTKLEIEAALSNATEARKVVFELFQDLDGFRLDDYRPFADIEAGVERVVSFLKAASEERGDKLIRHPDGTIELRPKTGPARRFMVNRESARDKDDADLLGLDHPLVESALAQWRALSPNEAGVSVKAGDSNLEPGVMTWWLLNLHSQRGGRDVRLQALAVRPDGTRCPTLERQGAKVFDLTPCDPSLGVDERRRLLREFIEPSLRRELEHSGILRDYAGFSATMVCWAEVV